MESAETNWKGKNEMIPVIINRNATNILIAKTTLSNIEVDFFTV